MADKEYKRLVEILREHMNMRDPRNVAAKKWLTEVWQDQRDVRTELERAERRAAEAEAQLILLKDELQVVQAQFAKYVAGNQGFKDAAPPPTFHVNDGEREKVRPDPDNQHPS